MESSSAFFSVQRLWKHYSYYHYLTEQLHRLKPILPKTTGTTKENNSVYFGDQGLLSAAFIGKMK